MRRLLAVTLLLSLLGERAEAQGSAFALRGLGWIGRPVSGRSAGVAGATGLFDPQMTLNPAAITRFRAVTGYAVGAPTRRTFRGPAGDAEQQTARFPLFGFAAPLPSRLVAGISIGDYLDRTYTISRSDSVLLRGAYEGYTDAGRSIGGVSDMALTVGLRRSNALSLGAAFHYYLGSTRLASQRVWDNTAYNDILQQSNTDFRGFGVGLGAVVSVRRVSLAASARVNTSLLSENTTGSETKTPLPLELNAGLQAQLVPGVFLNGAVQYLGWSKADDELRANSEEGARNTIGLAIGAEVQSVTLAAIRTPLRIGYRTRQLPFPNLGADLDENAFSVGIGFNLGRDRATLDFAFEKGKRSAGASDERFSSAFLGVTVRP